jgi:hypothetical protein
MIARLLRRDPLLRIQVPVAVAVGVITAGMAPTMVDTFSNFVELRGDASGSTGSPVLDGFSALLLPFFALQALMISLVLGGSWQSRRDGLGILARCRPMDLMLPIPPRASWAARLVAHGLAVVLPLAVVLGVFVSIDGDLDLTPGVDVGLAFLAFVLLGFGTATDRPDFRRVADGWKLVAALAVSLAALAFDLNAFTDGASSDPRWATEALFVAGCLWAWRGHRRLPQAWSALDAPAATGANKSSEASTTASTSQGGSRSGTWRVISSTLWDRRLLIFSYTGLLLVPMLSVVSPTWVLVLVGACPIVMATQYTLFRLRFLATLPIARSRLLAVGVAPAVVCSALGGVASLGLESWRHPQRPVVTLDNQVERLAGETDSGRARFRTWLDVLVPWRHWRLAPGGVAPEQISPGGESMSPRVVSVLGLPALSVYNPYDAPHGSSMAYTAWQFSRALEAEHGVSIAPQVISDRYLETQRDGEVSFSSEQRSHNLAIQEEQDGPWYGALGTLVHDYPEFTPQAAPGRSALAVLAVALLAAVGGAMLLALRPGSLGSKLSSVILPLVPMLALTLGMSLGPLFDGGEGQPQVLFALAGNGLLDLLPNGPWASWVWPWVIALLAATAAFALLARCMERAEAAAIQGPERAHRAG